MKADGRCGSAWRRSYRGPRCRQRRCCSGAAVIVQSRAPGALPVNPFFFLIGLTYAAEPRASSGRCATWSGMPWLADVHFAIDAVVVSAAVFVTGGVESYFTIALHAADRRREHGAVPPRRPADGGLSAILFLASSSRSTSPRPAIRSAVQAPRRPTCRRSTSRSTRSPSTCSDSSRSRCSAARWRNARGAARRELEEATEEIADLQAFNEYVLDNLVSGLATADARQPAADLQSFGDDDHRRPTARCRSASRPPTVLQLPAAFAAQSRMTLAARPQQAHRLPVPDGRRPRHRARLERRRAAAARRVARLPLHVPGRHRHQALRAERAPAAAPRGGRRDGGRHRARDSQPARLDVGFDADAASRNCRCPAIRRS